MGYVTVVPSTTITAAWGNANVRDQVVTPFASAAARTSAITAPVEGMLSYRSDVKTLEFYDSATWRQWLGIIAWGNRPTASTSTTGEIGVVRVDNIPVLNGHSYRISTAPLYLLSSVNGDVVAGRVRVSTSGAATTASTGIGNPVQQPANNSQPYAVPLSVKYDATATGTISLLLTVGRVTGTGSASMAVGCDLIVEDIGPTVADTGVDV